MAAARRRAALRLDLQGRVAPNRQLDTSFMEGVSHCHVIWCGDARVPSGLTMQGTCTRLGFF